MSSEFTGSVSSVAFFAWLEVHKTRLIAGAIVVAVLASGVTLYGLRAKAYEREASAALLALQVDPARQDQPQPEPEAYLKVVTDYSGSTAGRRARLLAADGFFRTGRYAESQAQFEAFLAEAAGGTLVPVAAFGVAVCLDAQNRAPEARAAYQAVLDRYPNAAVADQARMALAFLHETEGRVQEALRLYNDLTAAGVPSSWATLATTRKEQLLLKHPELAPTNAPLESVGATDGLIPDLETLTNVLPAPVETEP